MTPVEFGLVFGLGVASSLHCLQMCGPIVMAYSVPLRGRGGISGHLAYNAGRILTYTALGAAAGIAGSGVGLVGHLAGLAAGARIFAGAAMVLTGILLLRALPSKVLVQVQRHSVTAFFSRAIGKLLMSTQASGKFGLGLILGLLPCGLIYAALLKAVETANAAAGAATMLAFGLGTSLALIAMGVVGSVAGWRLGAWGNRIAAVSVMASGCLLLWRGLAAGACHG